MVKTNKKEESTALVVRTAEEQAYLDSIASESPATEYNGPRKLVINTQAKDAEGNRRPIGGWHIQGTDEYYDGEVTFRPIRHWDKLIRYSVDDSGNYKLAAQSIYFKDLNSEEILDTLGGTNLGRKFGKRYTDEEKEATKSLAEYYMDIFGFVTFGDTEHPVMWRVRGTKMKQMKDAFRSIPKGRHVCEYAFRLETEQPSGKQYWNIKVTPDLSKPLPISPILGYDAEILEFVNESNRQVISEYKRSAGRKTEDTLVKANSKLIDVTNTTDEEELPF